MKEKLVQNRSWADGIGRYKCVRPPNQTILGHLDHKKKNNTKKERDKQKKKQNKI